MFSKLLRILGFAPKRSSQPVKKQNTQRNKPKVAPERIGELGEHKINIQLDQLPKACKAVSDLMVRNPKSRTGFAQIDHVVVTPYGVFVIETKNYSGEIKGGREDKQWSVGGRFKMYNPLKQNQGHIKALDNVLANHAPLSFISLISFTMRCRFSIDPALRKIESDELVVYDVELSEFIQRKLLRQKAIHANPLLSETQISQIHQTLIEANVTDPALRREHVQKLQGIAAVKP